MASNDVEVDGRAPYSGKHARRLAQATATVTDRRAHGTLDISVVMPCLNEEASVGICVKKAWAGIGATGLNGEVIVVDNGSTDRSVAAAQEAGARVLHQPRRGYGNAYLLGFSAARGQIVVMGDSDDSYDFTVIPDLIRPISDGYDYVLGSRFDGHIRPDAMTWSHRWIGNPVLTKILNMFFRLNVSDAHSGFRALTREALDSLNLHCEGMEFASELVVKAARANLRTTEIPITYHPRIGESKLNSLRDGWRHLRFLLLYSPEYLFIIPGIIFTALGILGQLFAVALSGSPYVLVSKVLLALITLGGSQLLTLGLFAKTHAKTIGLEHRNRISEWVENAFSLERGLVVGTALAIVGAMMVIVQLVTGLDTLSTGGIAASLMIMGLVSIVLGGKICFDAFFLTIVLLKRPVQEIIVAKPDNVAAPASPVGHADPRTVLGMSEGSPA